MSERLTVTSGDAKLAVRIDGDAALPWIILSNSLASDMTMWDDQMADLTKLRRVLRYDTRGHGASSAPPAPYDFGKLVGDVTAVMDHLQIASADILGLSLGGMTALGLGLDHQDRVKKLICCDARGDFPPPAIALWEDRIKAVRSGGLAAITDGTLERWFTEKTRELRPDVVARIRAMIESTSVEGYCGCAAALQGLDYRRRLPGLRRRTLYITGDADSGAPVDVVQEMAAATPGSQCVVIPGAAHISNIDNTAVYNETVCSFLQSAR